MLLIERAGDPFKGAWAFPGGFLNIDEDAPDGARRELAEETGLHIEHIEQLGAFTAPDRDPRERVISIAYFTLVRTSDVQAGDDAARAQWFPLNKLPELAIDHRTIYEKALERLSHFIKYIVIACIAEFWAFMPVSSGGKTRWVWPRQGL